MDVTKALCLCIQLVLVLSIIPSLSAQTMEGRQGPDVRNTRQRIDGRQGPDVRNMRQTIDGRQRPDVRNMRQRIDGRQGPDVRNMRQRIDGRQGPDVRNMRQTIDGRLGPDVRNMRQTIDGRQGPDVRNMRQTIDGRQGPDVRNMRQRTDGRQGPDVRNMRQRIDSRQRPDVRNMRQTIDSRQGPDIRNMRQTIDGRQGPDVRNMRQTFDGGQGTDVQNMRQTSRTGVQNRQTIRPQSETSGQRRSSVPNRNTRGRTISRARSFPNRGSSQNMVAQIDPRIIDQRRVAFLRMRRRQPTRSSSNDRPTSGISTSTCPAPRSIRCYIWPSDRELSGAFRCEGRCRGRRCVLPCECSCVHPRLVSALLSMGRIRGPELRPLDNRLRPARRQDPNTNTPLAIRRALQRRLGNAQRRGSGGQTDTRTEVTRQPVVPTINFGISDDVLATLIAQPVLNEIVGPQGINQIIAGEPPPLLSWETMSRGPSSRNRQDVISGSTSTGRQTTARNLGIPVPISQLNLFQDLLPTPTEVPHHSTPVNDVNVQQLPGTNVLFVNLSRSGPSANIRSVAERLKIASPMDTSHSHDVINSTSVARDTGLVSGRESTMNTLIQEPVISSRFLPPTKAECHSMNLELWCDPQPPWDGTPGVSRWCLLNCRADNCDNQRCACSCIEEILFTAKYDQLTLPAP